MLNIALVDDHTLFRRSLSLLIRPFRGMKVVLEAENGEDFLEQLKEKMVDIVLLDIQMPKLDGFQTCKILHERYPNIKILIVSQLTTRECIHKVMELGAHGYFPKNADPEELETAIRSLEDKGFYYGQKLSEVMREALIWEKQHPPEQDFKGISLSEREVEIVKMVCREMNSGEIAELLCINRRTVEGHRTHIMQKTRSKNFIGVILFALRNHYFEIQDL